MSNTLEALIQAQKIPKCVTCESLNVQLEKAGTPPYMPQGGTRYDTYICRDCSAKFMHRVDDYRVVPITPETRLPSLDELLHNRETK